MRDHVINLLETSQERKRKIALLHYELEHPARTSESELISAMALGHGDGSGGGFPDGGWNTIPRCWRSVRPL